VVPSQKEAPGGWRHPRKSKSSDEELHVLFIQQRALDLRWSSKKKKKKANIVRKREGFGDFQFCLSRPRKANLASIKHGKNKETKCFEERDVFSVKLEFFSEIKKEKKICSALCH
jgi:hypothetical protein